MVIRIILRNIQNTLVISSVLLVILALQRLQQYDTLYNHTSSSFLMSSSSSSSSVQQQQQHQSTTSNDINLSWDDHHPLRWDTKTLSFWWTIPFAITKFIRRSSKRILRMIMFQTEIHSAYSDEDEEDNNNNNNDKNHNNNENQKRQRYPRRKSSWEISDTSTSLAFVIDLTSLQNEMEEEGMSMATSSLSDCYWRMDVIQMISYTLLSPFNSKSSILYVIVNDTMIPTNNNSSNSNPYWWWWCYGSLFGNTTQSQQSSSSMLHHSQQPSFSFSHVQMIPSSSIGNTYSCPELWQSFAMQNLSHIDVAIRLPITAIGHKHSSRRRQLRLSSSSSSSLSSSSSSKAALNSFQYSSQQSILWMRPKVAVGHNHKCESTPVMSCPTPCRITQRLTIWVLPRKCTVPWGCSTTNETQSTPSSITPTNVPTMSLCHDYHTLWYQQRRELEQQQSKTNGNSSDNKKEDICRDGKYQPLSSSLVYK